jgi:hypothetical protein
VTNLLLLFLSSLALTPLLPSPSLSFPLHPPHPPIAHVTNLLLPLTVQSLSKGLDAKLKKVSKQTEKQIETSLEKNLKLFFGDSLNPLISESFQTQFSEV